MSRALRNLAIGVRAKALLVVFTATLVTACATTRVERGQWPTPADVVAESSFTPDGLAKLDARMQEAVDKGEVSGLVTLLVQRGQVIQFKAHGVQAYETGTPMSANSLFRIYSMTKPITGVAMLQLYEKGLWKLDDPVTKFVPELASLKVLKNDGVIDVARSPTMRELMTHTTGLGYGLSSGNAVDDAFRRDNPLGKPNLQAMVDTVAKIPLLFQPGERWSYSIAVDIQGLIVERLSGKSLGQYFAANILRPLHMNDTVFFVPQTQRERVAQVYQWNRTAAKLEAMPDPPGRDFFAADHMESGGGGLVSSIHDYARFCQMLLNKGTLDGAKILQPESVVLMTQNHIGNLRLYSDGTAANPGLSGTGFGLDFAVIHDPVAAKSPQGPGTFYWSGIAGTWFWIDPQNELFFIGMIQRRGPAGAGAVSFRADSTKLVYEAMTGRGVTDGAPRARKSPADPGTSNSTASLE